MVITVEIDDVMPGDAVLRVGSVHSGEMFWDDYYDFRDLLPYGGLRLKSITGEFWREEMAYLVEWEENDAFHRFPALFDGRFPPRGIHATPGFTRVVVDRPGRLITKVLVEFDDGSQEEFTSDILRVLNV